MATTLGQLNPLLYRGYVYDWDTGLYYLQSRYYNPELGRFINADAFTSTGQGIVGNNMFAYCLNNPVNCADGSGTRCVAVSALRWGEREAKTEISPFGLYGEETGKVYIIKPEQRKDLNDLLETDVVIIDYRDSSDNSSDNSSDPNMRIQNSYRITSREYQIEICALMLAYNQLYPVEPAWDRTQNSLVKEWRIHNYAYNARFRRSSTAHADFNNKDEGRGWLGFIFGGYYE